MKYMGSKNRIAKDILPVILKNRKPNQWYVEPFVGGCNSIDKVEGNRIGNDSHEYLIAYLKGLSEGIMPPEYVSEEDYAYVRLNKDSNKYLTGYIGFSFSFGAKWFGGYRRDIKGTKEVSSLKLINEQKQSKSSYNSAVKQSEKIRGVKFYNCSYDSLYIPKNSIIYCDPPYYGTTQYKDKFDSLKFWDWVRLMVKEGHYVYVSEYNAPNDFECIWMSEIGSNLDRQGNKRSIAVEKLFVHKSQLS